MQKGTKRRLVIGGAILAGILLVVVFSVPLWFPWLLRPVVEKQGIKFGTYERQGYGAFVVQSVTYSNPAVTVQAGRVEGFVPTPQVLWQYFRGEPRTWARVTDWSVEIRKPEGQPGKSRADRGVSRSYWEVRRALGWVDDLLGKGVASNGTVRALGQTMQVPWARWDEGGIAAEVSFPKYEQKGSLRTRLTERDPIKIEIISESANVQSSVAIRTNVAGLQVEVSGRWMTNQFTGGARFPKTGVLPETATLESKAFTIPPAMLNLEGFRDVHGAISLQWNTNRLALHLDASALARESWRLPPMDIHVHAEGTTNSLYVSQAKASTPWMHAELSEGTRLQLRRPYLTAPTALRLYLDLAQQPWLAGAKGKIEGQAVVYPGTNFPASAFAVAGSGVQFSNLTARSVTASGTFRWPFLAVSNAVVTFDGGSAARAHGRLELAKRTVEEGHLSFKGTLGRQWLPTNYAYAGAVVELDVSGPLTNLAHSGKVDVSKVVTPQLKPFDLSASWAGQQFSVSRSKIQMRSGDSTITMEGTGQLSAEEQRVRLTALTMQKGGTPRLTLQQPFQVVMRPGGQGGKQLWNVQIEPFHWSGAGQELRGSADLAWPQKGELAASGRNFDLAVFQDFLRLPERRFSVEELMLKAQWNSGPVTYDLKVKGDVVSEQGLPLRAEAEVKGTAQGVTVENLAVYSGTQGVATAQGFVPLLLRTTEPRLEIRPDAEVRLRAMAVPHAAFWNELGKRFGASVHEPNLQLDVAGTWKALQGNVVFELKKLQFARGTNNVPPIENVRLTAVLDREWIRVKEFVFHVANEPVTFTGSLPLGEQFWTALPGKLEMPDWEKGNGNLIVRQAELASFSAFLPKVLRPRGVIGVDLAFREGDLKGKVTLRDVTTEPLATMGPIRNLQLTALVQGRTISVQGMGALGSELVLARGSVNLQGEDWLKGVLPPFTLNIRGTNLTLTRQPEAIIRGDLDLTLTNAVSQPVLIVGQVRLHDSLYLQELKQLVEGQVAKASSRPPYFSIATEPLARWRLDVKVTGERFLRVRSPVFQGEVSASIQLSGTLKDPIALGQVKVEDGAVRFPFASLPVTQGLITLTSDNPYRPQLFVNAAAQVFGYDVKLQITGTADDPIMQFSSTPALGPDQILLMLGTGEVPRGALSLSGQRRAQTLAMFLGRSLLSQFGFGTGAANRLTIQSGENLTETGRPTYSVEYRLTPRWSVIGQYDRFNDYNLMLKWQVYSR